MRFVTLIRPAHSNMEFGIEAAAAQHALCCEGALKAGHPLEMDRGGALDPAANFRHRS
jgi:hypothetical protein